MVHGFATLDPDVRVAGVICNRVGSRPATRTCCATRWTGVGVPVLGALAARRRLTWRDRHLGLVPVVEHVGRRRAVARPRWPRAVERELRPRRDRARRRAAPADCVVAELRCPRRGRRRADRRRRRPAFSFTYADNLEALAAAGAELVPFDPCADAATARRLRRRCVAGGGFPEVYAAALAANTRAARRRAPPRRAGLVVWAECGGLLWLAATLDDQPMAGVRPDGGAHDRPPARSATGERRPRVPSPLGPPGTALRGHEFHYSVTVPPGDGLALESPSHTGTAGWLGPGLFASYLHLHLGAAPELAEAFVRAAATAEVPEPA